MKRERYIISYDISNDERRLKMAKELLKFCFRTQKSVFEGKLLEKEVKLIKYKAEKILNFFEDVLYIIPISNKDEKSILRFGVNSEIYNYTHFYI